MAIAEESTASGISFALTDEQSDLRALAHEFAEKEIRPVAAEYDEHQTHPADVIAKAHELGLMNVHIPQELGGPGLSIFDGILIGEELSWGCSGIAVSLVANTLGSAPVLLAGTDEQKQKWLPPLLEEPLLCSFALTEPNAGSDVSGHPDDRRAPRRRVRDQRFEDVHLERGARGLDRRLRVDRQERRASAGCPRSSSRPTPRASRSRSTSTRWASGRPTPPRSRSRT